MQGKKIESTCRPGVNGIVLLPNTRTRYNTRIDKDECNICIKKSTCNCYISNKKECDLICIGCGVCLCHPERLEHCIDGHYVMINDSVMCMECYERSKKFFPDSTKK